MCNLRLAIEKPFAKSTLFRFYEPFMYILGVIRFLLLLYNVHLKMLYTLKSPLSWRRAGLGSVRLTSQKEHQPLVVCELLHLFLNISILQRAS